MTSVVRPEARFYDDIDESSRRFATLLAGLPSGATVLELGEEGRIDSLDLAARGCTVLPANTSLLDIDESSVDAVIGVGALRRLDVAHVYAQMARVLRADGKVVLLEPLGHNPLINVYRRRTRHRRDRFEHPVRREDILLAGRWFGSVDVNTHHLLSIVGSAAGHGRAGRAARRLLRRLDRTLLRDSSPLRWQAWLAVVELGDPLR